MWFYAEVNKNPELLIGIVSEEDVLRIACKIGKENDEYARSRISFELALSRDSGEADNTKEPLLAQIYDVLDETFLKSKEDSSEKQKIEQLYSSLGKICSITEDQRVYNLLLNCDENIYQSLDEFKKHAASIQKTIETLLHDSHHYRKKLHNTWGEKWSTLSRYKKFLYRCALLYCELTGEKFTVDFHKNSPNSPGTRFLYEFHKILNQIAKLYSCKQYTDSNFATACKHIRKSVNSQ